MPRQPLAAAVLLGALTLLFLTAMGKVASGQSSPAPEKPSTREEAQKRLDALDRETPVAQEILKLHAEAQEISNEQNRRQMDLYGKVEKVRETEAYTRYAKQREALELKQAAAWEDERREMAVVARTLYASRHDELENLGQSKRWKEFGGVDKPISPMMREPESGSRELFDALVTKGALLPPETTHRSLYSNSMIGPYNQVTEDEGGIGYSVYYYERYMALSPFTRVIAIDGIEPTAETIASGRYPLVVPLYTAHRASDPPRSPARKLLDWLKSAEGQAVVRESGYVTLR